MKFRDFKIIIDGTLDNDDDAESIKAMFGGQVKVQEPDKEETTDDNGFDSEDPVKKNVAFPLQQEIELAKAEQGKQSDTIDDITDEEDIEAEQESIPLPTLLGGTPVDDNGQFKDKDQEDEDEEDEKSKKE